MQQNDTAKPPVVSLFQYARSLAQDRNQSLKVQEMEWKGNAVGESCKAELMSVQLR